MIANTRVWSSVSKPSPTSLFFTALIPETVTLTGVQVQSFTADHLTGVLRLCIAENWPAFPDDPERAIRILTAAGVTGIVALDDHEVIGFTELFSDGELQPYLANLAVDAEHRRRGIARMMIEAAFRLAGGERVDLPSEEPRPASTNGSRTFP